MSCPVYLVDDDLAIIDSVSWLLEGGEGFDVHAFQNAESFLSQVEMANPGVMLLDINMPGIDGLELQKKDMRTTNMFGCCISYRAR